MKVSGVVINVDGSTRTVVFDEWSTHRNGIAGEILNAHGVFVGACEERGLVALAGENATEPNPYTFPACFSKDDEIFGPVLVVKQSFENETHQFVDFTCEEFAVL